MTKQNKTMKLTPEQIEAIGAWTVKLMLIAGTIVLLALGKEDAAGCCGGIAILSFFLF